MRVRTHPGDVLHNEYMVPLGITAAGLAGEIKVTEQRVHDLIAGSGDVDAEIALRLARHLGTRPEFWLNLQQTHDLSRAMAEDGERINQDVRPRPAP